MAQVDACLGENVGYVGERLACLLLYSALSELARYANTNPPATIAWL